MPPFEEFLNDPREVHAFTYGIREGMIYPRSFNPSPMPTGIPNCVHDMVFDDVTAEYHYYVGGFYAAKIIYVMLIMFMLLFGIELI